jgi:ATP-dependent Lhr-like helicase
VALLLANREAERFFKDLKYVVLDELHSLVTSKRGHMLSLGLARLRRSRPAADHRAFRHRRRADGPAEMAGGAQRAGAPCRARHRRRRRQARHLDPVDRGAHSLVRAFGRYAIPDVYKQLIEHQTTLLFVNTRSQAEMLFQELWTVNEDNLPIALHHGSLDVGQRRKVEAAMAANKLRAVVATSTLDLGIDWGDVDLVIHVGAPKGASRLPSASAAPTTGWTSRRRPSWCRPTASR